MEPEISRKMLTNLHEKLKTKLPATTRGYSMLRIFRTGTKPSQRSITAQKDNKRRKIRKGAKKTLTKQKPKDACHFLVQILISAHAWAKML